MSAFDGIRVVELTEGIAGPVAAMFLADFGADVIKVEPPEGDHTRETAAFVAWNRGKRGLVAHPDIESDRHHVRELLHEADVIIVSHAEDLSRWEVDAHALSTREEGPVVLEVPAWQGETPWYGGAESQALLAAASGYSRRQSSFDGGPVDMVYPHLLYIQGLMGATAITAALVERLSAGCGQVVTVDGLHAVTEAFTGNYSMDPDMVVPDTAVGPRGLNPMYCHYEASDGTWFLIGGLTPKFQERILRAIGEEWILDDPRLGGSLATVFYPENREWIREVIGQRMATRPRAEWLDVLREAGVPCAPLNEPLEAFEHEHTKVLGLPVKLHDPQFGDVTVVGQPVEASVTPACVTGGSPVLGTPAVDVVWEARESSDAGRGWIGATGGRRDTGGPLSGVRVLLVGTFVAGPFGAFLLGHFGADVIKVEAPEGDPWRAQGFYYSDGMRSVSIDLKKDEGRELFLELASEADIIVDNLRPGVGAKLGIDYTHVSRVNPDIITVSFTGFGQRGPLAMEPGFDPVLQAWGGMCIAQGGDDVPVIYTVPVNDVSGAGLIAFSGCLGLYHRLRTGTGQAISTSLVGASMFMQSGQLVSGDFESLVPRGGRDYLGPGELDRYYQTGDGWVRLQATAGTTADDVRVALGAGPEASLEDAFARIDAESAAQRLYRAAIPAAIAQTAREVVVSGRHPDRFTLHRPEDDVTYYRPQQYVAFSRTKYDQHMYPPGAGEHSREILDELELSANLVERYIDAGAVVFGAPMRPRVLFPYR